MQMSGLWLCFPAIVLATLVMPLVDIAADSAKSIPVEVWSGSDDGVTLRLRDTLESALKSSTRFNLSFGKKPGTLVVDIPTHARWKQIGGRNRVFYSVEFSSGDQKLGADTGSCWDDEMPKCAARIVRNAQRVVGKIHPPK